MLRVSAQPFRSRFAAIVMMAATLSFMLQATFIAHSESATGESSRYHHGFARSHQRPANVHSHEIAHVHADGTIHRHVVVDDDGALDEHIQEPGCPCCWNMAIVVGVLPNVCVGTVLAILDGKLKIEMPASYRGTEPTGPRRPPRPPA